MNFRIILPVTRTKLRFPGGGKSCAWLRRNLWLAFLLLTATALPALEVREMIWGFDGKVVPNRFNILSVLVVNDAPVPFDGTISFFKSHGLGNRIGAPSKTACYLSPQTARWLQFYIFADNQYDQWRLEWGRGPDDHRDLEAPKWGSPAQVWLTDDSALLSASSAFKQFPEALFPATVAGAGGLESVLLDHAPHWETAKQLAFLDWLRAGGKLHLLLGTDGRLPLFSGELSVLNESAERVRWEAGMVTRHPSTIREIRKKEVLDDDRDRDFKPEKMAGSGLTTRNFLNSLAGLSRRHYNWAAIYLLGIAFVVLVGPGNLRAARKIADYRFRILLLLGTIAAFTFLFSWVGRRGAGEMNVVHSISLARAVGGDTYNVLQWVNAFAAQGAHYTITHPAPHNLYDTGDEYEAVNGWIQNGKDGMLVVDIPMFSRRGFLHQAEMKGHHLPLQVTTWDLRNTLTKLTVAIGPDAAKPILAGWVVAGDWIYPAKIANGNLEFDDAFKEPLESFKSSASSQQNQMAYGQVQGQDSPQFEEDCFQKLAGSLIAWSLGGEKSQLPNKPSAMHSKPVLVQPIPVISSLATGDRVQLFLFARSPKSFNVAGGDFREVGYVLYHFDLFKPETKGKL